MKDGKSLPVLTARRGTENLGYQIIITNNSKKNLEKLTKTWKTKFKSPNSCCIGSVWDVLPVHTQAWDARGALAKDTALVALGDTGAVPGLASTGCLQAAPPSLTEVAAELFSHRNRGGILGKRG